MSSIVLHVVVVLLQGFTMTLLFAVNELSMLQICVEQLIDYEVCASCCQALSQIKLQRVHAKSSSILQVNTIHDALSLGQQLQVKVMGHDQKGNLQISHKALTDPKQLAGQAEDDDQLRSGALQRPSQAVNTRFQHSGSRQREQGSHKPRMPQAAVADAS